MRAEDWAGIDSLFFLDRIDPTSLSKLDPSSSDLLISDKGELGDVGPGGER